MANTTEFDIYEDTVRRNKSTEQRQNKYSPYCDFIYYKSTLNPELTLAMRIIKPDKPSYILCSTHGWHMSINGFEYMESSPHSNYLKVFVDMRGRAFSDGKADCNGYELYDVYDAVEYVKEHYREYILDDSVVYFEAGSGGGGNCYELLCKFPDYFAAATALFGISDYQKWYQNDKVGEFCDEMDVWINTTPDKNPMAYMSRSGIDGIINLTTPLFIAHGETDIRVPLYHAEDYIAAAEKHNKASLITYYKMEGVGTLNHWGNATDEQVKTVKRLSEQNRAANRKPVNIPKKGTLCVHGYLVTKHFSIFLDSIDKTAMLTYDLSDNTFSLNPETDHKLIPKEQ